MKLNTLTVKSGAERERRITHYALRIMSGFTLVELMAVIVIIGIVSGIVIAGAGYANKTALKNRTVATIQQVCTAIEMRKADTGAYVPDFGCRAEGTRDRDDRLIALSAQSTLKNDQYVWSCEALWFWLEYNDPHRQAQYQRQPYLIFKREQLITGNTKVSAQHDQSPGNYMRVVDAWGNPLNYKSYEGNSYRFSDGTFAPRHNTSTYDLCSYGADGTTWKDIEKPFDRSQDLKLDQMTTVVHYNGRNYGQIPDYLFKPYDTYVTSGGGTKHCYGGEDHDDINNWQQR